MGTYVNTHKETKIDANGNTTEKTTQDATIYQKNEEPDFIKLYTKMWCEFNKIPLRWQPLFLSLVMRMTYCNKEDLPNSQIVGTGGPIAKALLRECGWETIDPLYKGLKELTKCGAIRKISKGYYQINPQYAGRGYWKYNPKFKQGGIEDLVATFDFKNGTVETNIIWAGDNTTHYEENYDKVMQEKVFGNDRKEEKTGFVATKTILTDKNGVTFEQPPV